MTSIATKRFIHEFPHYDFENDVCIIKPFSIDKLIDKMLEIKTVNSSIEIFDVTRGYPKGKTFTVGDHINRTGSNPLMGRQKQLGIDFPDLSNLYLNRDGIVTDCLGDRFDSGEFEYPSTWLCHISIVARAVEIETISGKLISI